MSQQSDLLSPDEQDYIFGKVADLFPNEDTFPLVGVNDMDTQLYIQQDVKHNPYVPPPQNNVPSNEEYAGPYEFDVYVHPNGTKNPWVYSATLNKVYMDMRVPFPVDFKIKNRPESTLYIRTTPVYSASQFTQECVYRCINHEFLDKDQYSEDVRQHVIRCKNPEAIYLGDRKNNERLSIIIPFSYPQTGTDNVREMFEFVCKNSCPTPGMNRRAIEIIFTLEDDIGHIKGRRVLQIRVCSCPKRDKEKDEKEHNHGQPPKGKKRKAEKPEKTTERKVPVTNEDLEEYALTIPIVGKNNAQQVLKYCQDLMSGNIVRNEGRNDQPYRQCLDGINELIKQVQE